MMTARNLRHTPTDKGEITMSIKPALPLALLFSLIVAACGGTKSNIPDNSWEVRTGPQSIPQTASIYGN